MMTPTAPAAEITTLTPKPPPAADAEPTTLQSIMTTPTSAKPQTEAATPPSSCKSERALWQVLGYTEDSWDNPFGNAQLPWASIKYWSSLTANEKAAAVALGYNEKMWDNDSNVEPQPASVDKSWAELAACAHGKTYKLLMLFSY